MIKECGVEAYVGEFSNSQLGVQVTDHELVAKKLFTAGGVPASLIDFVWFGPSDMKADCEFGPRSTGLAGWLGGYSIHYAERIARRWARGEKRIEIGMKYPSFDLEKFTHQFKVRLVGPVECREITYWLYKDVAGNVYTFAPDAIGKGGYAGAVMADLNQARRFLRFLLGSRKHYIKDINVGFNCLGGMGIKEVDELSKAA